MRLIIFFAAKDGETLYSEQEILGADCSSNKQFGLLPNSDLN